MVVYFFRRRMTCRDSSPRVNSRITAFQGRGSRSSGRRLLPSTASFFALFTEASGKTMGRLLVFPGLKSSFRDYLVLQGFELVEVGPDFDIGNRVAEGAYEASLLPCMEESPPERFLLKKLKESAPNLPVIILTSSCPRRRIQRFRRICLRSSGFQR